MSPHLPPAVLWMDPGGMSGIARYERGAFSCGEYPFRQAGDLLYGMCQHWGPSLAIGWERYRALPGKPQANAADAIEPIGVARYFATAFSCAILPEAQQHTPDATDQQRLKALGWWIPGQDDSQSAACHLLLWLMREGRLPAREARILRELRDGAARP